MRVIREVLHRLNVLHNTHLEDNNFIAAAVVRRYIAAAMRRHLSVSTVDVTYPIRYIGARFRFDCPMLEAGMIAVNYRFKNVAQLQQLREGLQLPEWFIIPCDRCKYHCEELLLIVLERCALGARLIDLQNKYHRNHSSIGKAINYFCSWMQQHWGYLLHDNLEFWKPYLRQSRDAIVIKLTDYYHGEVLIDDDFPIMAFMDCVIFHTSRPGGGPMQAGVGADRFPDFVQRGFYNHWAKKHGIKKQSACLANGMTLDVGVGFSCRRNDVFLLRESNMNNRLIDLTADLPPEEHYMCYGDSAYPIMARITSAADDELFGYISGGMNSCRESIEWNYRDIKIMWRITSSKYELHLLEGFRTVDNMIDLAFIFNNAWNCMNGNECSQFFRSQPPSFATYTSLGPR
jgi:hypothetical protein